MEIKEGQLGAGSKHLCRSLRVFLILSKKIYFYLGGSKQTKKINNLTSQQHQIKERASSSGVKAENDAGECVESKEKKNRRKTRS